MSFHVRQGRVAYGKPGGEADGNDGFQCVLYCGGRIGRRLSVRHGRSV